MPRDLVQHRWVQGWHINASGSLFGGQLLSWVDEDTMMVCHLNASSSAIFTTKGMERVNFINPCRQGDHLRFHHFIVYVGKTSLWTFSSVTNENEGEDVFCCYTALVSIDVMGKPRLLTDYMDDILMESVPRNEYWNCVEILKELQRNS